VPKWSNRLSKNGIPVIRLGTVANTRIFISLDGLTFLVTSQSFRISTNGMVECDAEWMSQRQLLTNCVTMAQM